MNLNSRTVNRLLVIGLCLSLLVIFRLLARESGFSSVVAAPPTTTHRDDHANHSDGSGDLRGKMEASLKKTFEGTVDVYHTAEELTAAKPGHAGLTFVGLADITGKELLVFSKGKEHWVIDPDLVYSYRVTKGK